MHGYDHPWPGGGNENLWIPPEAQTYYGVDVSLSDDGGIILSGTPSTSVNIEVPITLKAGTYYLGDFSTGSFPRNDSAKFDISQTNLLVTNRGGGNRTGTLAEDISTTLRIRLNGGFNYAVVVKPMLISGSSAPTTYSPYSNICPISGWTEAEIYHEAEYDADASPKISVNWEDEAGTVYGGTLTLNPDRTGTLVVDKGLADLSDFTWAKSSSYRNVFVATSRMPTNWPASKSDSIIADLRSSSYSATSWNNLMHNEQDAKISYRSSGSGKGCAIRDSTLSAYYDNFDLAAFKAAISGRTVLYPLATPKTIQLTAEQISDILTALDGTNVIWANTGDVTVTYIAKSAKFSFDSPLHTYNYNNLKLFGNTYIEHGKG